MRRFARLIADLERDRRRDAKLGALVEYFADVPPEDAAWAAYFLTGRKLGGSVSTRKLMSWAALASGIPDWLAESSYGAVGDLAETAALLVRRDDKTDLPLHEIVERTLVPPITRSSASRVWRTLASNERIVWNKIASRSFRPGVTTQIVARAIAKASGVSADVVAHRLEIPWEPTAEAYHRIVDPVTDDADSSRPYALAAVSDVSDVTELGDPAGWRAEWKWDGVRAEIVRRGGRTYVWSAGDLVTDLYPEIADASKLLPDGVVLDGEIVAARNGKPLPKAELLRRVGAGRVTKKVLQEAPVMFVAFDVLEHESRDVRGQAYSERVEILDHVVRALPSPASEVFVRGSAFGFASWDHVAISLEDARSRGCEGLVLKYVDAAYSADGAWRALRVAPFGANAVLLYVERGGAQPEYTFALRRDDELVPIAKTSRGISPAQARKLDRFARLNTVEAFGPVRRVEPKHVFVLAFDAVEPAPRRKAGIVVRSPRVLSWLTEATLDDVDTLASVRELLDDGGC